MTEPTFQDRENARRRQEVADRFRGRYLEALQLAESVLGRGWEPHGRHDIIENDEADAARREDRKPVAVASVISARKGSEERHLTVIDGVVKECGKYDEALAELLAEKHPTMPIYKHQVHWSGFEADYRPRSADQLAAARERREEKKEAKWQEEVEKEASGSLFPEFVREQAEEARKAKGRKR